MEYTVTIEGLDALRERLGQGNEVVRRELLRAMTRAVVGELGRMPAYPPPPDGSWYRRTGTLGRSLTALVGQAEHAASDVQERGQDIVGLVGTNVAYASYVIGRSQARAHRGRWWLLEESVLSHRSEIEAEFEDAAARIVEAMAG